jgi:hypothetical protein
MLMEDNTRTIDEAYSSAVNATTIRLTPTDLGTIGSAEVLLAAGTARGSTTSIGAALLRLHSEYDSAEKPRMAPASMFAPRIQSKHLRNDSPAALDGQIRQYVAHTACQAAQAYNEHETRLLLGKLKALPCVRRHLTLEVAAWKVEHPQEVGTSVLCWWLNQTCPVCNGTRWQTHPGGKQGAKACKACGGTGKAKLPYGEVGRRLASFIEDCVDGARQQIRVKLRNSRR